MLSISEKGQSRVADVFYAQYFLGILLVLLLEALTLPLRAGFATIPLHSASEIVWGLAIAPLVIVGGAGLIVAARSRNMGLLSGSVTVPVVAWIGAGLFGPALHYGKLDAMGDLLAGQSTIQIEEDSCDEWCERLFEAGKQVIISDPVLHLAEDQDPRDYLFFSADRYVPCAPSVLPPHSDLRAPDLGVTAQLILRSGLCISGRFIAKPPPRTKLQFTVASREGPAVLYDGVVLSNAPPPELPVAWAPEQPHGIWPFRYGGGSPKSRDELSHSLFVSHPIPRW